MSKKSTRANNYQEWMVILTPNGKPYFVVVDRASVVITASPEYANLINLHINQVHKKLKEEFGDKPYGFIPYESWRILK